jgi:membrane-bound metal-dependent hydrolase YbcI (DUF457 family)
MERVLRLFSASFYVRIYRGPLHSLFGASVLAVVAAYLWWRYLAEDRHAAVRDRSVAITAIVLAFGGCGSHLLLDLFNGYGVQLFWPFTQVRVGWPLMADYDLPVLVLLGLSFLGPALLNAVNREIGAARVRSPRAAWIVLGLIALLLPTRAWLRARAWDAVHSAPLTEEPESQAVFPSAISPWIWVAVEETSISYMIYEVDAVSGLRRPYLVRLPKPRPNNLLVGARDSATGRAFLQLATYPFYSIEEGHRAVRVRIRDLAFYSPGGSDRPYSVEIELTSTMKILSESAVF